jgi:hypothetical protein
MGIARRKAGTVVRCPTCSGQVVVPNPDATGAEPSPQQPNQLFERSDFDELFDPAIPKEHPGATVESSPPQVPAVGWGTQAEANSGVARLEPGPAPPLLSPPPAPGIVLSPSLLTLLTVLGILLLAVVFGAGILVGKLLFNH